MLQQEEVRILETNIFDTIRKIEDLKLENDRLRAQASSISSENEQIREYIEKNKNVIIDLEARLEAKRVELDQLKKDEEELDGKARSIIARLQQGKAKDEHIDAGSLMPGDSVERELDHFDAEVKSLDDGYTESSALADEIEDMIFEEKPAILEETSESIEVLDEPVTESLFDEAQDVIIQQEDPLVEIDESKVTESMSEGENQDKDIPEFREEDLEPVFEKEPVIVENDEVVIRL